MTWGTTGEADTYFVTRYDIGTQWSGMTTADKTAALTTAQDQLVYHPDFSFSTTELATPTTNMQKMLYEQALFLRKNRGYEGRLALQAMGVENAGIVREQYNYDQIRAGVVPIGPSVLQFANDNLSNTPTTRIATLTRNIDPD